MRDEAVSESFTQRGGTELAPISTTTKLEVALKDGAAHAGGQCALLLKLRTESFMQRGADLDFLSCFPGEKEVLFPPLTYLKPTGKIEELSAADVVYTIVDVVPHFPS